MTPAFILIGASKTNLGLYSGLTLYAIGSSLMVPCLTALASCHGTASHKGTLFGIQSPCTDADDSHASTAPFTRNTLQITAAVPRSPSSRDRTQHISHIHIMNRIGVNVQHRATA
ncbi:hypothetical protein O3P69_004611 [Scylla paramamosain]|uniref:Uncharacterized protein n=1 Tax=Scylla paramamosain TaxID=85552 RepID=A0AAW0UCR2_SCYPA